MKSEARGKVVGEGVGWVRVERGDRSRESEIRMRVRLRVRVRVRMRVRE